MDLNHRPFAYQANATNQAELYVQDELLVGPGGIEPPTSALSERRPNQLDHGPS